MSFYARGSAGLTRRSASVGAAPVAAAAGAGAVAPLIGLCALGAAVALRSRWVTMAHRPVLIDDEGRIEGGGVPEDWHGIHIRDVSPVAAELREIEDQADDCETPAAGRKTFPTVDAGVAALLEANPNLQEFLEVECSNDCDAFRGWVRGGRLGPKPKADPSEGRFDTINEQFEKRKPGQKVASWIEAVYVTVPKSRRWADFEGRAAVLSEATGVDLVLPAEAEAGITQYEDVAACQAAADERIDNVLQTARAGRYSAPEEDVPF